MTGCRGSNSAVVLLVPEPSASRTSQPGNTLASTMPGSKVLGSRVRPTVHTQCAGRRWRISTGRRVTFERCRLCSDRRSSKAPSVISGSRWMTLSASQGRSNSEGTSRPCHLARPQLFGHEPTSAALKRTPGRGTFPVRRHGGGARRCLRAKRRSGPALPSRALAPEGGLAGLGRLCRRPCWRPTPRRHSSGFQRGGVG